MTEFNITEPTAGDDAARTNSIVSQLHGGGGEGAGEFDLTLASAPKKSLPLQAMSVGLVLLVGAGSLYLMRRQGTRAGIDFNAATIVSTLDTTVEKIENEDEILRGLEPRPPEQVPKEQVPDGPFKINKHGASDAGATTAFMDPAKVAAERRRVEIQEILGRLQVESVMHGRIPIAKISGKFFRVGDKVADLFVVGRIEDRSVFLTVDDKEYELSMVR
jgi:hypothetical protein